ncbi:hypothetical protein I3842_01G204800 [Carya illinoinensis]|uniref:S-protein homolog n=1 Tax=Carya illinoinensis TaxID=32201 RepID=A0A922KDM6_CARIL|nr:hypothetical protein I3842_01G204800 [Carya illinoinensis]
MARVSMSEDAFLQHKATVRISNDLGEGMELLVHCMSADDDLGTHLIFYHSGYYQFEFRPNFVHTTLYHCGFQWNDVFHHFNIYIASRDQSLCTLCLWNIQVDRPCMFNEKTREKESRKVTKVEPAAKKRGEEVVWKEVGRKKVQLEQNSIQTVDDNVVDNPTLLKDKSKCGE